VENTSIDALINGLIYFTSIAQNHYKIIKRSIRSGDEKNKHLQGEITFGSDPGSFGDPFDAAPGHEKASLPLWFKMMYS
jgi:hypothetical protein